jgi:hypothetical protein
MYSFLYAVISLYLQSLFSILSILSFNIYYSLSLILIDYYRAKRKNKCTCLCTVLSGFGNTKRVKIWVKLTLQNKNFLSLFLKKKRKKRKKKRLKRTISLSDPIQARARSAMAYIFSSTRKVFEQMRRGIDIDIERSV